MSFIVQSISPPTIFGLGQATAVAAGNVIDYYVGEQDLLILTSEASSNWILDISYDANTSLDSEMLVGDVANFKLGVTNGNPAFYQTEVKIDGTASGIDFAWASGIPSAGTPSAIDFYDFEILKTNDAQYKVLASLEATTLFKSIPDAPPAPVASAISGASVRVSITNPTNTGGLTITQYLVSSSTGISQVSAASPIVITGLTSGVPVSFTARVKNAIGISNQSSASNTIIPADPVPGQAFEGGFYAGDISTAGNGIADYRLVVAPKSTGETLGQWKTSTTNTAGTSSVIDGPTNSANMNNASHPCAQFCENLTIGGFTDWYMPAQNELEILYYNLKGTTTANIGAVVNANSVPSRASTPYTSSVPGMTSATDFQNSGGTQFFSYQYYWSSTQSSATNGAQQTIGNDGEQFGFSKTTSFYCRAVRRVPI